MNQQSPGQVEPQETREQFPGRVRWQENTMRCLGVPGQEAVVRVIHENDVTREWRCVNIDTFVGLLERLPRQAFVGAEKHECERAQAAQEQHHGGDLRGDLNRRLV